VRKVNKIRSFVGVINFHEPLDEKLFCEIKVLKKQGNEYKYLPYRWLPVSFCDEVVLKSGKNYN
jgi:hypothetical protein